MFLGNERVIVIVGMDEVVCTKALYILCRFLLVPVAYLLKMLQLSIQLIRNVAFLEKSESEPL